MQAQTSKRTYGTIAYVVTILYVFPVLWLIMTSLKSENAAVSLPPQWFFAPSFAHYIQAFFNVNGGGYLHSLGNSVTAAAGGALLGLILGVPAAFALTLFPGKKDGNVLFWLLSTKMMPMAGIIVPLYVIVRNLQLLDNIWVITLIYAGMSVPMVTWMMYSFFKEVPIEIWEAAQLDGLGPMQALMRLGFPLLRTGISSSFLIMLVLNWNEFFVAVNLSYDHAATLPILISGYMSSEGLFWAKMSAAGILSMLPILIVGWLVHKQFVRGMTFGAVKS